MQKKTLTHKILIDNYSSDGFGQGQLLRPSAPPHLVEVPFSMPGDEVVINIKKKRGKTYQGTAVEWLHRSKERVIPRCQHAGSCGGCRWQHIAYDTQLKMKEELVLKRLSPLLSPHSRFHSILPSDPWHYRNKMEFSFSSDKQGRRYLGLILQGTRGHVFQLQECQLMNPWAAQTALIVTKWWEKSGLAAYHTGNNSGSLRSLTLREGLRTGDRLAMLTVSGHPDYALKGRDVQTFVEAVREAATPPQADQKLSIFLRIQQTAKGRATQFYEMHLFGPDHLRETLHIDTGEVLHFRVSPTAFFQPNTLQAEKLYSRVMHLTPVPENGVVLDLYCGTGTLGICMGKKVKRVIGIELSPESSLDAKENARLNRMDNIAIKTGDVGELLPQLLHSLKFHPCTVLVDPPRAGLLPQALTHIAAIDAPHITYVSCNPVTQAANIAELAKLGYAVADVQPVDQFPHTIHVENIVTLIKS